jgi:AcrR family transcriptional regulator
MPKVDAAATPATTPKRADARRNEQVLLEAAAAVFLTHGVNAPVRVIAANAGVGMGTIYRHFPTRADLIVAVYRHQVETLASDAPRLLVGATTPSAALAQWMDRFVDFLVTKHGLAGALRSDESGFQSLHAYFLDRLVPACASILTAAVQAGQIRRDVDALALMHATGNLCIGVEAGSDTTYDAHLMVGLLIAGLKPLPSA